MTATVKVFAAAVALVAVGCVPADGGASGEATGFRLQGPLLVSQQPPLGREAAWPGVLQLDGECLRLTLADGSPGGSVAFADGVADIVDSPAGVALRVPTGFAGRTSVLEQGDIVVFGGGELGDVADDPVLADYEQRCGAVEFLAESGSEGDLDDF